MNDYQQSNFVKIFMWIVIILGIGFIVFMLTATEYEKTQLLSSIQNIFYW